MRRTGQATMLEQTVLFGIGIAVAFGFLAAFQTLQDDISGVSQGMQTRLVSEYVALQTARMVQYDVTGTQRLSVPEQINGRDYAIRFESNQITIVTPGSSHTTGLYGLERGKTLTGSVVSRQQPIVLQYDGTEIAVEAAP